MYDFDPLQLINSLGVGASVLISISIMGFWYKKRNELPFAWVLLIFAARMPLAMLDNYVECLVYVTDILTITLALCIPFAVRVLIEQPTPIALKRTNDCLARALAEVSTYAQRAGR